jgi:uncharacterized MAPEG superfamily protein
MGSLPPEQFWLAATAAMTSVFWVPYIVNRLIEHGIFKALWDPQGDTGTKRSWADRMMRAHRNAVENLCVFAPLVLLVAMTGARSSATGTAAMIYFFARLGHFIVFTAGLPVVRVLLFLVGFGCQAVLAVRLFQVSLGI